MHEYSIVSALMRQVEAAASENGATAVHRIRVKIGELAGVEPELFATAFELCRERTICSAAQLEIVPAAGRVELSGLRRRRLPKAVFCAAPACELPARLAGGDEIILERIEMEVPEIRRTTRRPTDAGAGDAGAGLARTGVARARTARKATAAETMEVHRV